MRLTIPAGASGGPITQGGNDATVFSALADAMDEAENPLFAAAGVLGWNGATMDRIRSEGTDRDAIAVATLGRLEVLAHALLFNGTSYDRQRALGTASLDGLGQLSVSGAVPGASVVKGMVKQTVSASNTRVTMITPTSGKRIRVISVQSVRTSTTVGEDMVYFGTGANILTTPANVIYHGQTDSSDSVAQGRTWPDGGGPVGAVDAVVSIRVSPDIGGNGNISVHFREE